MMMGNPRGFTQIEIGGKIITLRYDFNALCLYEEKTGKQFPEPGWMSTRALLWAGLQFDPNSALTLEQVGALLTPYLKDQKRYGEIVGLALDAWKAAFPETQEDKPAFEGEPKN